MLTVTVTVSVAFRNVSNISAVNFIIFWHYRVNHNLIAITNFGNDTIFNVHGTLNISRTWNTKRWPPNYDVMIWWRSPRHAPHIWTRQRQCVFDLPYACMCKHPRGSKLSSSNVIRRGEVRWSHNVQFCLKSEVSLEHRGRSRSPVSCARKAADDEDLQLGYVVRSVAIEFSPNRQCRTGLSYSRVPTPAMSLIGAYQNCFVRVSLACQ